MSFLTIQNVSKSYGALSVLRDINIAVEEGEFLVLVGPSGCGKSTLLNIIAGLEELSAGDIIINGKVMNGVHPAQRNIAMVFQSYALYPNMTVRGNITFGLEMNGVPKAKREEAVASVAKLLQIEPLLDRKPSQLSGGQRQRVAMGRALVRDPDVFLFDEPLSNLDAKLRVDMRTEIKKLHKTLGTTIVYVTHDQIEALTLSTRIAVMYGGDLQQLGTPKEIYDQPENLFVATFMGSPAMNILPATIEVRDGKPLAALTSADGKPHKLPVAQAYMAAYEGKQVKMGIRPEAIREAIAQEMSADVKTSLIGTLTNTVDLSEPTGADTFISMSVNDTPITARLSAETPVTSGDELTFAVNMDKALFFDPKTEARLKA